MEKKDRPKPEAGKMEWFATTLFDRLEKDVRFIEGLKSCIDCGACTAVCPAAEVSEK